MNLLKALLSCFRRKCLKPERSREEMQWHLRFYVDYLNGKISYDDYRRFARMHKLKRPDQAER